jgi:hypothetical protein
VSRETLEQKADRLLTSGSVSVLEAGHGHPGRAVVERRSRPVRRRLHRQPRRVRLPCVDATLLACTRRRARHRG